MFDSQPLGRRSSTSLLSVTTMATTATIVPQIDATAEAAGQPARCMSRWVLEMRVGTQSRRRGMGLFTGSPSFALELDSII